MRGSVEGRDGVRPSESAEQAGRRTARCARGPRQDRVPGVEERGARLVLHRREQPPPTDAERGRHGGDESMRRATALALRILQPRFCRSATAYGPRPEWPVAGRLEEGRGNDP